jgi:hypothetical protein
MDESLHELPPRREFSTESQVTCFAIALFRVRVPQLGDCAEVVNAQARE